MLLEHEGNTDGSKYFFFFLGYMFCWGAGTHQHIRWCSIRQSKIARCFAICFSELELTTVRFYFSLSCHRWQTLTEKTCFLLFDSKLFPQVFLRMCWGHIMLFSMNKKNTPERTVMALQGNLSTNIIILFPLSNYNPATIWTQFSMQHSLDFHVEWLFLFTDEKLRAQTIIGIAITPKFRYLTQLVSISKFSALSKRKTWGIPQWWFRGTFSDSLSEVSFWKTCL